MTKIEVDDGKSKAKKPAAKKSATQKPATKKTAKKTIKVSSPKKRIAIQSAPDKPAATTKNPTAPTKKSRKIAINAISSSATHNTVQKSTTLSRRYVKKPSVSDRALKSAARAVEAAEKVKKAPEIKKSEALKTVPTALKTVPTTMEHQFKKKKRGRRLFFALVCSAATVGALVAFVNINMPDISVRVAAMQTGIEATYPTFIPRNYNLANVISDKDGIVTMYFDGPDGAGFSLSEEQSTWDSTALLNNYVKKNYPSDYTTLREQGITIYVRGENASWVNGGLLYKIEATGKNLTKEQIRNIATSL